MELVALDALGRLGQRLPWYRSDLRELILREARRETDKAPPLTSKQVGQAASAYEELVTQVELPFFIIMEIMGPCATRKQVRRRRSAMADVRARYGDAPISDAEAERLAQTRRVVTVISSLVNRNENHVNASWQTYPRVLAAGRAVDISVHASITHVPEVDALVAAKNDAFLSTLVAPMNFALVTTSPHKRQWSELLLR